MDTILKFMRDNDACREAYGYALKFKTPEELWENCDRGDWMLWFIGKTVGNGCRKKLVFTACQCARLSLKYGHDGELRPLQAIETAEAWSKGQATIGNVRIAARAAAYAAYAADAADVAAHAAHAAAARKEMNLKTAEIVRQNYTLSEVMAAIAKAE